MTAWLLKHWRAAGVLLAAAAFALYRWATRRQLAAVTAERDRAATERDAAIGTAAVADRHAELVIDQARNDADGAAAAEEIANVPTTGSPADRVRAIDAAARRLRDADDSRAVPGHGGKAAVPPKR